MGPARAVFFDIDGTLLDEERSVKHGLEAFYAAFGPALGTSQVAFGSLWRALTDKHHRRFLSGELDFQGQRRARMRELFGNGISDGEADARFRVFLQAYEVSWAGYEDVAPCLESLAPLRLGVISNGDPAQQAAKLKRLGLSQAFPVVVTAGEVRHAKPAPEIFLEACRRIGLRPGECAYVGDNFEMDALGSQGAGLRGLWLNRGASPRTAPGIRTISTLRELRAALDE